MFVFHNARSLLLSILLCARLLTAQSSAARDLPLDADTLVWQTVQEYFIHSPPSRLVFFRQSTPRVNHFLNYSHLGTDFGFHGPAAYELVWRNNVVRINLRQHPDAWAGMWHSLAGLARETHRSLNFCAAYPAWIRDVFQPRIEAVQVNASGQGTLKLEIKGADQSVLWTQQVEVNSRSHQLHTLALPSERLKTAKFINWTVEPRSDISVNRLSLGFRMPGQGVDHYAFLASYAKVSRCFEGGHGLARDRAHTGPGAFDTVPTSGLFVLATAAAASPGIELVSADRAREILRQVDARVAALAAPLGILPHFLKFTEGRYHIHPGTEFSTVDTAIYYHAMLLAARMLQDSKTEQALLSRVQGIQFDKLLLKDGSISHGLLEDGASLIQNGWREWGGETMLVLLLRHLAAPGAAPLRFEMAHPGEPYLGTGFIAELQSLFYPDFDSDSPDAVSQTCWRTARLKHLDEQRNYAAKHWRGTLAHELGLYGLSAGENATGTAYQVNGTKVAPCDLIHPHYFMMSACLRDDPEQVVAAIDKLRRIGLFPPCGLVENFTSTGSTYLPMNGSLNAGFEAVAAYHFLCRTRKLPDHIYEAARSIPQVRRAMRQLLPGAVAATGAIPP